MNRKKMIKAALIVGMFFFALGAWLLHLRIHPLAKNPAFFIPFVSGLTSVVILPLLFCFRKTLNLAYIINGFSVIIGTITMAHFSIVNFNVPLTAGNILMNTLSPDIAILWMKFAVGKALFGLEFLKSDTDVASRGRFFRYPNMGWWWLHLFGLAIIYALGNILWK